MKYAVALVTFATFLHTLPPSVGQAPAHLEFVRGLRAQQLSDYALQYLQRLSAKPPADVAVLLPLEMARTRMELAQLQANETRKLALYGQARADLLVFLEKNPKHPLAAEANLDIARLAALQGKNQLSKARRQETTEGEKSELLKARALFVEAGKQLKAAADRIDAQLAAGSKAKTPEAQKAKQPLTQAKLQAELEQAINLLDQAQTYHEGEAVVELKKRAVIVGQAIKAFEKLSQVDEKNPLCWEALVWLGRSHQENDDPISARKVYQRVITSQDRDSRASRLARYFQMLVTHDDKNVKDPLEVIRKSAEQWVEWYPNHLASPEGYGVRYELANVYYQQALRLPKAQQVGPKAKELLTKAQRHYQALEQTKNDFSERSRRKRLEIILLTSQDVAKGTVDKLKNFDECFLRAQVEIARMNELAKKDLPKEKLAAQRTQHFQTIIEALNRGLSLADAKVARDDRADARYLLTYAYLAAGDPYRAAVVGEELARAEPKASRAAQAGAYALYAYSQVINEERQTPGAEVEAHRNRIRHLALYIEKTWPEEPAADDARFQLGLLLMQAKKYAEAVEVLERISSAFNEAIRAQYQLAMAATQAQREQRPVPKGQKSYEERAVRALKNTPDLPPGADAGTAEVYFLSRLELSRIHYSEKKFADMNLLLEKLGKQLAENQEIDKETKSKLAEAVRGRKLLAQYGVCEELYSKGEFEKVRAELDPVIKQLEDPTKAAAVIQGSDPRLVSALMGLALRANIQDSQLDRAKEVLAILQKGDPENSRLVLLQLAYQLEKQIQELRQQEGEDAKKQLEQTTANFTTFLAELGKQENLGNEMAFFLAQSYVSLDKPKEAAGLLTRISEPAPLKGVSEPKPPPDPTNPNDKQAVELHRKQVEAYEKEVAAFKRQMDSYRRDIQVHRASRILLVRALRQAKDYPRALKEADTTLKQPWAQTNMDLQKERIFILEDQGLYGGRGGAVTAWYNLMDRMKNELGNPRVKEVYFECYFYFSRGMYINAQKLPDAKKKADGTRRAAQTMVNLKQALEERQKADTKEGKSNPELDKLEEAAWARFAELLEKEPPLKQAFEELRKSST